MGALTVARRVVAGFIGLSLGLGIVVLFGLVALVALQPRDGLAWVRTPDLGADLRLDAGLRISPLKSSAVADALRDRALERGWSQAMVVPPGLAVVQTGSFGMTLAPTARLVLAPTPVPTPRPRHTEPAEHGGE